MDDVTDTESNSDSTQQDTSMKSDKEYCSECGKPLGNTVGRCYECGGENYRGGSRIGPDVWQAKLGVLHIRMKRETSDK